VVNKIQNRLGLVNGRAVSIHHDGSRARICPVAFILAKRRSAWLIAGVRDSAEMLPKQFLA
jgi:hypothetical protein